MTCAYASHGDTKHVLLIPGDPGECFTFGADAFDLADRLQAPIFVMSDLDIGMNDWVIDALQWDDKRRFDRGKVLDAAALDAVAEFKRYKDVDGDGIPYRTLPGTHPDKGAYFTRGTSHNDAGGYTEDGTIHAEMLERISRKYETARDLVPKPDIRMTSSKSRLGIINFGSTDPAVREAIDLAASAGCGLNHMRLRAFPFSREVSDFIDAHDYVFVVEQNRDAQMRHLLIVEAQAPAEKLVPVNNCDGMPLTAKFHRRCAGNGIDGKPRHCRGGGPADHGSLGGRSRHDPYCQACLPPPQPAGQRLRPDPPRLRRRGVDPVRRLRPRFGDGGGGRGLFPARHRGAPGCQGLRHRLLVQDHQLLSSTVRTVSTPCTGACRRWPPAPTSPTAI